ncbi:hypothetical protein [Pseudolactococcus paracarnosus]|uniref:Uncharacterized protein n=1 Tax=Pseudolactococcus paracarnosus TaxID=2749962 RepID=A0ABT0AM02_9LACT|nr:hypothetical protein [Lactococcus paracarnosus]MCJ1977594.1 hypothetical protein [Lactococcus paracarnosus]MCJ1983737.1 hypothetical protein [Lactococcus paracarnosus]MCJ1998828.1 hypothetical protein [Lactococcus paracarnosus]
MEIKYSEKDNEPRFSIENLTFSEMILLQHSVKMQEMDYDRYTLLNWSTTKREFLIQADSDYKLKKHYFNLGKLYLNKIEKLLDISKLPLDTDLSKFLPDFLNKQETALRYAEYKATNQSNK